MRRMSYPVLIVILLAVFSPDSEAQNWQWQYPRPTGNTLWDVTFTDSLHGCAVGSVGTIIRTVDGGQSWQATPSGLLDDLHAVAFANPRQGWIAGGGSG